MEAYISLALGTVIGMDANPSSILSRATDGLDRCLFRKRSSHSLSSQLGGQNWLEIWANRFQLFKLQSIIFADFNLSPRLSVSSFSLRDSRNFFTPMWLVQATASVEQTGRLQVEETVEVESVRRLEDTEEVESVWQQLEGTEEVDLVRYRSVLAARIVVGHQRHQLHTLPQSFHPRLAQYLGTVSLAGCLGGH